MKFQHFIRSQKRRAETICATTTCKWDFWTLSPESAHQVAWLFGDRGIPRTWRHMNGYGSHIYSWINADGKISWVKYHFISDQGVGCLTQDKADRLVSIDGDSHARDLHETIKRGDYPSWTLKMQIMPFEDAKTYWFNPFDLTKVWPHADYPPIEVGKLVLNRDFTDHHTEIEQAAFTPSNQVPGTGFSPTRCCSVAPSPMLTPTAPAWG
jgi:catalase